MTSEKDKRRYYTSSVHFSLETMRQATELEKVYQESRSRIISRAVDLLYCQYEYQKDKK